ncbi:hypothetical protein [Ornithobacterium rhinotracheale]
MKDIKLENWWSEFAKISNYSSKGHYTVKEGSVGTPVCVMPLPYGGDNNRFKYRLKLIENAPKLLDFLKKSANTDGELQEEAKRLLESVLK